MAGTEVHEYPYGALAAAAAVDDLMLQVMAGPFAATVVFDALIASCAGAALAAPVTPAVLAADVESVAEILA